MTLPNGFILRGETLLTSDRRLLARELEFVCFDDRFVDVTSYRPGGGGLFDARSQGRVPYDTPEVREPGGLRYGPGPCNGYYTAWLGPGILYAERPHLMPNCAHVNRDNPSLQDRAWLERPCIPRDSRRQPGPAAE